MNLENKQQIINQLLNEEEKEYRQKLSHFSKEAIERAFLKLKMNYEEVHKKPNENVKLDLEDLDEETKSIFILIRQYQEDIKQIFLENDATITHITTVSPENMIGGKIKPSHNRANNYEIERGDWLFASSSSMDGKNPYIARQHGMILLDNNTYIYGGDIFDVQIDEEGKKSASLRNPNYVYKINPSNFTPVVMLKKDNLGVPFIEFSEEWISENEVDLGDPTQIMGEPTVISSIMELLENYQILSDVKKYNKGEKLIGSILRECNSLEDAIILLREYIQSGDVRYINEECGINVKGLLPQSLIITGDTVINFSKDLEVVRENESAERVIDEMSERGENERAVQGKIRDVEE